ncbi:MAG: hypothetical protein IJY36_02395 [Coprobacter sp.]|nr:hypothetical protein [Coprobacter sp.]
MKNYETIESQDLQKWAEETREIYKKVLRETGCKNDFNGSQSPLNVLSDRPEIVILGKNPGHDGEFKDTDDFKENFLKGNKCWACRNNRGWQYWKNIKSYLGRTFSEELLEDDGKRVLTNATFFAASKPNKLPPRAYEDTIKCTLSLIDKLQPKKKVVICMGASEYYRFITDLTEYNDKYSNEGLFYGERNGIKYIGIPHPSGRQSKLKRVLIREFIYAAVNSSHFEEVEEKISEAYNNYNAVEKTNEMISREEFIDLVNKEFPNKKYRYERQFCYIQAGNVFDWFLHYELNGRNIYLHIEGRDWRPIRDFLSKNVVDNRVTKDTWWRIGCKWKLNKEIITTEDVKDGFIELRKIMEPYILKFEESVVKKSN